ncbi:hypothetical protein AVEN_226913-1, partial [Araneus ventricosus]
CDLSQESEILSLFDEIRKTYGRLDVCINNAGLSHNAPLLSGTTAEWRNMLDVSTVRGTSINRSSINRGLC